MKLYNNVTRLATFCATDNFCLYNKMDTNWCTRI